MQRYMILAVVIRFFVDFLLLYAVKRLFSPFSGFLRPLLGATIGGIYAVCCILPPMAFLRENLWYMLSIMLCCLGSFGFGRKICSATAVYCLLRLTLDGLASGRGAVMELLMGIILSGLFLLGFGGNHFYKQYIPVELGYGDKIVHLQALWDTGHDLRDPITGKSILVVSADVAESLTGLEADQLRHPVDAIGTIPGLRLIPYQTLEQKGQMMLAMTIPHTKIGKKKGPLLVAFAPQVLDSSGKFQALIGGSV